MPNDLTKKSTPPWSRFLNSDPSQLRGSGLFGDTQLQGINGNANTGTALSGALDLNLQKQLDFTNYLKDSNISKWSLGLSVPTSGNPQGLASTAAKTSSFGVANFANAGLGFASGVSNIFDINNADGLNSDQKRMMTGDAAVNAISQVGSAFGPVGSAIGAGLNIVNSIGGKLIGTPKAIKNFSLNDTVGTSSSYGGVSTAAKDTKASGDTYQNSGLVGKLFGGKKKILGKVANSNYDQSRASDILNTNKSAMDAISNSTDMYQTNYINRINGLDRSWMNGSIMYGQDGGVIFKPVQKPSVDVTDLPDLTTPIKKEASADRSRLADLAEQHRLLELENLNLENKLNATQVEPETQTKPAITATSSLNKFSEFENAGLQLLQRLNPGKKVEIKFEDSGVYNKDGSRNWSSQAALLKQGASKTALSLHNFGAARDYRLVVDGKTVPVSNTKLYKDVIWGAAKQTGLHTIGEWDVAHVGLAKEGTGNSWQELADKFPDVFKTQLAKDTIEGLKKAGQSKYLTQLARPLATVGYSKEGGKIHIKKKNKGKFTEYKKRTGKTTEEAKHSKDPKVRKMANFAANAKKWKHQEGGQLLPSVSNTPIRKAIGDGSTIGDLGARLLNLLQGPAAQQGIKAFRKYGRPIAQIIDPTGVTSKTDFENTWSNPNSSAIDRTLATVAVVPVAGEVFGALGKIGKRTAGWKLLGSAAGKGGDVKQLVDALPSKFKEGGSIKAKNVIVHGNLHARKHTLKELKELADAEITLKGIPVITMEAEGGKIEQQAEVEGRELVLHYELTMKLEELRKEGTDEAAIKAGKLLARELMRNTKDKTGTLRSIRDKRKELENV
jgi:hypothetical protein